jgi:hypothetical protein
MRNNIFNGSLILLILFAICIYSCSKTELSETANANDVYSSSLSAFFADELESMTFSSEISAVNGGNIALDDGTIVNIPANSFINTDGSPVSGNVEINVATISGNADMAMVNIPSTSNGSMLLSGGVVNIEATQSGANLNLDNPINISVPNSFENNTVPGEPGSINTSTNDMEFFIGVEQDDGTINWELDNSTTMNFNAATNSFDFSTSQVGFINCDAFSYDPENCGDNGDESCYTSITLSCPESFDPALFQVWLYFNDLSSLLGIPYNSQNNTFEITDVLAEQTINIVVLAEKDGAYYTLKSEFMESGLPHNTTYFLDLNESLMEQTTTDEWKDRINGLP